jgi:sterol O-acyltransferase
MSSYYRDWNLVVYEWLYAYVYRDVARVRCTRTRTHTSMQMLNKPCAVVAVFFLSALAHEWWFICGLRLFCPVVFVLYSIFGRKRVNTPQALILQPYFSSCRA